MGLLFPSGLRLPRRVPLAMSTFFHGIQYAALYILLTTGICFLVAGEEQRWSREEHTRIAWILAYFSVGTCFYLVLNKLFEIMIPHVKGTEIDGFPRWRWWLASFGEAVILNLCMSKHIGNLFRGAGVFH